MCGTARTLARERRPGYAPPEIGGPVTTIQGSCQAARRAVASRLGTTGATMGACLLLCLCVSLSPCVRLRAQSPARAPGITVVATPAFRPTAVLLPHFQFEVAVDSAAGGVVFREVTINPVTFTGWVRVEGFQPGERASEAPPFSDSVRFSSDGRVTLLVADSATRAPLEVEAQGDRNAAAGKLVITSSRWPYGRVVLVTIDPADLYEHRWRAVGLGVRDRIRVDDGRHIAFLQDSTIANAVIAVAPGRGTRAAIRTETTSIVLTNSFGGVVGRERRAVGRLVLALEPSRDSLGRIRAEVVFGLGRTEDEAADALAQAISDDPAPFVAAGPRVATPTPEVGILLAHVLAAAQPMLRYDRIATFRNMPAGSYTFLAAFDRDGWYGATTALQLGDPEVVCSEYGLMKQYADPSGAQRHEVWNRLGAQGRYVWTDDWGGHWMADKDPYQILKGYACYRATRDTAWLGDELPNLRRIARYVLRTDRKGNGLVEGVSYGTYSEMSPLSPTDDFYLTEDPYVNALAAYALDRLAELEDEAGWRLPAGRLGDSAAVWRGSAARIRAALPTLWRPRMGWFTYHAMADSARSWDHYHLQPVDALVFGAVADTALQHAMIATLLRPQWWDARNRGFFAVPSDDPWFNRDGYWTGWGWHIMDFKALEATFRYGSPDQRRTAWRRLGEEASRIIRVNYGRPGERGDNNGLFMFSAGSYLDLLARGLFGVDEHLDSLVVAPHVDGVADDSTWRLDGWRISGDSLSLAYRPAARTATIGLVAAHHTRLVLRFPWLAAGSCAELRRGAAPVEHPDLTFQTDGSAYLDLRGFYEPAVLTLAARPCGS
jgi:hypothetical protein